MIRARGNIFTHKHPRFNQAEMQLRLFTPWPVGRRDE